MAVFLWFFEMVAPYSLQNGQLETKASVKRVSFRVQRLFCESTQVVTGKAGFFSFSDRARAAEYQKHVLPVELQHSISNDHARCVVPAAMLNELPRTDPNRVLVRGP